MTLTLAETSALGMGNIFITGIHEFWASTFKYDSFSRVVVYKVTLSSLQEACEKLTEYKIYCVRDNTARLCKYLCF